MYKIVEKNPWWGAWAEVRLSQGTDVPTKVLFLWVAACSLPFTTLSVLCFPFAHSLGVSGEENRDGELPQGSAWWGKKQLMGV